MWRCRQIWTFTLYSRPNLIMIIPVGFYLVSLGTSNGYISYFLYSEHVIGSFVLDAVPPFNLSSQSAPMLLFFCASFALNVTLTALIIFRLQACRSQARKILGGDYGKHYNILTAIFAESAFMNAIMSALIFASIFQTRSKILNMLYDFWLAITPSVQVSKPLF